MGASRDQAVTAESALDELTSCLDEIEHHLALPCQALLHEIVMLGKPQGGEKANCVPNHDHANLAAS